MSDNTHPHNDAAPKAGGKLLALLIAFLASDAGQALIAALIAMLTGGAKQLERHRRK